MAELVAAKPSFGELSKAGKPTGPKGKTIRSLLMPGHLYPELVAAVEFVQTEWAVIQVSPRKKRWWERRAPSFSTFSAKYGDMKITTHDGYVCSTTGVMVDEHTRRAIEVMGFLDKPYAVLTRPLERGPIDHDRAPSNQEGRT